MNNLPLVEIILGTIAGIILTFVKKKISAEKLNDIVFWVGKAVEAFEGQINKPNAGDIKKEKVTEFINSKYKNSITKYELDILIEYHVYRMNLLKSVRSESQQSSNINKGGVVLHD